MKILLANNTQIIANSYGGYGKQLHHLIKMFSEHGYEIYYFMFKTKINNNEPFTKMYTYDDFKELYTINQFPFVENDILKNIKYFTSQQDTENEVYIQQLNMIIEENEIEKFFFLGDIFTFYVNNNMTISCPSYLWYPCHYYPFSDYDLKGLEFFHNVICLTPSMKLVLEEKYPEKRISYLPHVCEEIPIELTKTELRQKWTFQQEQFVVTIVAQLSDTTFSNRKAIDVQLIAFNEFHKKCPNAFLFLHLKTYEEDEKIVEELVKILDFNVSNFHWNKNNVFEEKDLFELYKLSDVVLNCSKSEGFGVPIVEAQMYETNVITTNFLSMAEHNFQNNIIDYSSELRHFPLNGDWVMPSSTSIVTKLEEIYHSNDSKINRAKWMIKKLTSYENIKENLYKIMN